VVTPWHIRRRQPTDPRRATEFTKHDDQRLRHTPRFLKLNNCFAKVQGSGTRDELAEQTARAVREMVRHPARFATRARRSGFPLPCHLAG
jgi:hypothetical protein